MAAFVDTSGLFAVCDADDRHHGRARQFWERSIITGEDLVTTNYVVLETFSLLQRRLGIGRGRSFQEDVVPLLRVEWVDAALHSLAVTVVLAAGQRHLSLVDCVSFEVMRRLRLAHAFAFDRHFETQGFTCLPGPVAGPGS